MTAPCPVCNGTGEIYWPDEGVIPCPKCSSSGARLRAAMLGYVAERSALARLGAVAESYRIVVPCGHVALRLTINDQWVVTVCLADGIDMLITILAPDGKRPFQSPEDAALAVERWIAAGMPAGVWR